MRIGPGHGVFPEYGVAAPVDLTGGPSLADLCDGEWQSWSLCQNEVQDWWFAYPNARAFAAAVSICAECPVRRQCLASSLVFAEEFGVWGGCDAPTRTRLLERLLAGETLGDVLDAALGPDERSAGVAVREWPLTVEVA